MGVAGPTHGTSYGVGDAQDTPPAPADAYRARGAVSADGRPVPSHPPFTQGSYGGVHDAGDSPRLVSRPRADK